MGVMVWVKLENRLENKMGKCERMSDFLYFYIFWVTIIENNNKCDPESFPFDWAPLLSILLYYKEK